MLKGVEITLGTPLDVMEQSDIYCDVTQGIRPSNSDTPGSSITWLVPGLAELKYCGGKKPAREVVLEHQEVMGKCHN